MTPVLSGGDPPVAAGVYIHTLNMANEQAQRLPKLPLTPASWPQPAPFHNRTFPDQHNFVGRIALLSAMKQSLDAVLTLFTSSIFGKSARRQPRFVESLFRPH